MISPFVLYLKDFQAMSAQYTLKASLFFLSSLIMGAAESTVRPQQPDFDAMDLYEVLDIHEEATNDEIKVSLSLIRA